MVLRSCHRNYAELLSAVMVDDAGWNERDLGEIVQHLLGTPIRGLGPECDADGSVQDLLADAEPPVSSLALVKAYAKSCRTGTNASLPPPVATVLYYAVLATAAKAGRELATQLDRPSLILGLKWLEKCPWCPEKLRSLARDALQGMTERRPGESTE